MYSLEQNITHKLLRNAFSAADTRTPIDLKEMQKLLRDRKIEQVTEVINQCLVDLGKIVKSTCEKADLSYTDFSLITGWSKESLSRFMTAADDIGKGIPLPALVNLTRILNRSANYILFKNDGDQYILHKHREILLQANKLPHTDVTAIANDIADKNGFILDKFMTPDEDNVRQLLAKRMDELARDLGVIDRQIGSAALRTNLVSMVKSCDKGKCLCRIQSLMLLSADTNIAVDYFIQTDYSNFVKGLPSQDQEGDVILRQCDKLLLQALIRIESENDSETIGTLLAKFF